MTRREWLASLKPSDEIAQTTSEDAPLDSVKIRKVERIGRDGAIWWGRDGGEPGISYVTKNGKARTAYGAAYIQPVTSEIRRIVALREARALLRRTDWDKQPEALVLFFARLLGDADCLSDVKDGLRRKAAEVEASGHKNFARRLDFLADGPATPDQPEKE